MEMLKANSHLGLSLLISLLISSHMIHTSAQQIGFPAVQPLNTHSSSFGTGSSGIPEFPSPIDAGMPAATATGQPFNNQMQNGLQPGYPTQQQQIGYTQQNLNPQGFNQANQLPFAKISNQAGIGNSNNPFFNGANSREVGTLMIHSLALIISTMAFLF